MSRHEVYRLTDPVGQVGLPAAFKWAVGKRNRPDMDDGDGPVGYSLDFVEAFRTKREAKAFAEKRDNTNF